MKTRLVLVANAAVLLTVLTAGCASVQPDPPAPEPQAAAPPPDMPRAPQPDMPRAPDPQPQVVEARPAPPDPPVSQPKAVDTPPATPPTATRRAGAPVGRTPAPTARAPQPAAPLVTAPAASTASTTLDLEALKQRLKDTKAIGIFTKLSLKNQVDDLLDQFRDFYQGKPTISITSLRQSYNMLMMKVLSLLQDKDRMLASTIVSSREVIWAMLADPKTFATLQS